MLESIIGHKSCKFPHGEGNVRACAIGKVHALPDNGTVREGSRMLTFIVSGRAHVVCETKRRARSLDRVTVFHVEVGKNATSILFLVNDQDTTIPPTSNAAAKKPLGIPTVGNSKFRLKLEGGKIGLGFGIGREE
jgi:hypothetical protein